MKQNKMRKALYFCKHSIASEAFCMNQVTFTLQNIKIRLWQAVKILKGYWNVQPGAQDKWCLDSRLLPEERHRLFPV